MAVALGRRGYALALAGRRRATLEETAELTSAPETLILDGDLSDPAAAERAVSGAVEGLGGIGALVNNAGGGGLAPLRTIRAAEYLAVMDQNATSAACCTMAAWNGMSRLGRAVVVNVASMAVYDPLEGFFAYAAAKGAMAAMTVSAAKEGRRVGIEAYCICPGAVETPLLRSIVDERSLPRGQALSPADVAGVVVACISGDRRGDNGGTIPVLPRSAAAWWNAWRADHACGWLGMEPVWGPEEG